MRDVSVMEQRVILYIFLIYIHIHTQYILEDDIYIYIYILCVRVYMVYLYMHHLNTVWPTWLKSMRGISDWPFSREHLPHVSPHPESFGFLKWALQIDQGTPILGNLHVEQFFLPHISFRSCMDWVFLEQKCWIFALSHPLKAVQTPQINKVISKLGRVSDCTSWGLSQRSLKMRGTFESRYNTS